METEMELGQSGVFDFPLTKSVNGLIRPVSEKVVMLRFLSMTTQAAQPTCPEHLVDFQSLIEETTPQVF